MVYIKSAKIALSYPRFQFSFQGAFDTVESLAQATSSQHHPRRTAAGPAPSRSLGGPKKTARVHARRSAATTRTRLRVSHSFLPL